MEKTNSLSTINTSDYNTIINDNTKPIQKIAIKTVNDQNKQLPLAKGYFSEDGTVFPHESIILRGLTIKQENCELGNLERDIRLQWPKNMDEIGEQFKETKFKHTLPIFQPEFISIAAIVQHYKNKYDINIYCINKNVQNSIGKLAQQLKNGEQVGIIATIPPNKAHMTPIVICKQNEEVYIVTMDSVNKKHDDFWSFFSSASSLIATCGTQNCHLLHAGISRQKDGYSCMSDAIIILKDALRNPNFIIDLVKTSKTVDVTCNNKNSGETVYQVAIAEFPKFLYKTVQNKQLLDQLTTDDLQTPLTVRSTKQQKTLQTHFNKYNRFLTVKRKTITTGFLEDTETNTEKNWQVNTYLHTKPYRMLVKSVEEIADSNGEINQETATKLMEKYFNPSF